MDAENHDTLTRARAWLQAGHAGVLMTVAATWGSSPRPVGAMMCVRDDGLVAGSVSGGCVEDDLIERIRHDGVPSHIGTVVYGVSKDEAARFGLPCGGTLRLVVEPLKCPCRCGISDQAAGAAATTPWPARP